MGPTLSEIKVDIDDQMEKLYIRNCYKCQTKEELNEYLQMNYLKSDLIENINGNNEAYNYYNKVKNKYLEKYELVSKNRKLEEKLTSLLAQENENDYYQQDLQQLQNEISLNNQTIMNLEQQKNILINEIQKMNKMQQDDLINHQNYLRQIQEKNYEEIEAKDKALEEIMNKYETEMQIMKQKAEKDKKEFEEKQKKAEENNKKIIENLEKRIKQEKDEIKKQKLKEQQELNKKKEEIRNEFIKQVENIKKEKINEIVENFEKTKDTFCIDKIFSFTNEKMELFILKLFRSEKLTSTIIYHLNIFIENIKHKIKNIEHLNIILVGPCGSGKSTLINSLLNVNAEVAFGKPVTKKFEFYSSEKIPFLRLTDSRGIEKNEAFGVNSIYNLIKKYIETKIEENDPEKFIHCIWYCWTGTRLEDSEFEILKKLSEQYTLSKLPIIIVYTQATNEDSIKKAKEHILSNFEIKEEDFIPILAQEVPIPFTHHKIHPFGLNRLIEDSINRASSAVDSACYEGIMEEMKKIIKNKLEELMKKLKEKSNMNVQRILSNMLRGSNLIDLKIETLDFITNLIYQYFFMDTEINYIKITGIASNKNLKYSISPLTKLNIKEFVIQFFEATYKYFNKNLEQIINKYEKELLNEILRFKMDFNQKHDNLLHVTWTSMDLKIQLKNYIKESVYQKFELTALQNSFKFITNKLIEEFGKFFLDKYIESMEEEKFKILAKTMIKVSFDKIKQKIKDYTENNKEKYIETTKKEENKKEENLPQKQLFKEEEDEELEAKKNNGDYNNNKNDNTIV